MMIDFLDNRINSPPYRNLKLFLKTHEKVYNH